ncbi:MAG: CPBP family intramembrane metalloprotease [Bacteroidetes bacterium]|nr:CPBP family intramembrane metalloprotease [Bacteroidota bacterium]
MENSQSKSINSIRWSELVVFYVVSVMVSAPFRLNLIHLDEIFPLPYGLNIIYRILRGIGPAIGFIVVYYLLNSKVERKLSFWGVNKLYSFLAVIIIPVCLGIAGVSNSEDLNKHYYGFLTGIVLIFYALGEEYGWRGYLQQALEPMKAVYRIFAIALLWYFWHLNFLLPDFTIKTHLVFFLFLLLGSWGLLKISESTFSILFVVAVHLAFNILSDVNVDGSKKIFVLAIAIVLWTILIISLNRRRSEITG